MTKKGLAVDAIGVFVLVTVSLLILLTLFGTKIWPILKPMSGKELCKQSVLVHAQKPVEAFRTGITCKPDHLTIGENLAAQEGQDAAKAQLAKALYECWDVYGQGKLNLFTRSGAYCGMCSYIDFSDKKGKITGLTDYLGRTNVPNTEISYLDFFAGYETPRFRDYMNNPTLYNSKDAGAAVEIDDTSQRWVTIMVYARGEDFLNRVKDGLTPSPAGGGREIGVASFGAIGGAGGAVASFLLIGGGPVGWGIAGMSALVTGGMTVYSFSTFTDKPQWMAFTRLVPYNEESLKKLGCEILPVEKN